MDVGGPLLLVVACALLNRDNKVLLAERPRGKPMAGLWEFPGGKIESGETPEESLVRELEEELGLYVQPKDLFPLSFASYSYETFHLLMPFYLCRHYEGIPQGREGQNLQWVFVNDLDQYPMPIADKPLVKALKNYLF
ncbi:8-oxo-dGTP diphosphatase MutT [Bartonella ancashensis]|uniref:8-oxo-dGTP diphosphatase n=1 Tax=Bartonella ancashensis TaxID=1318743 RepID=A0A0M3T373_9HYPH|nr:8-oxo-dGTP diphosphatase MutT [Bartonella ancashensis]ALE04101.1 5-methyl-dCTP pyrophosphohydrolase [Bartonella ancashensis]